MRKIFIIFISLTVSIFFIPGCSKKNGCTDPTSNNYDKEAEEDDGSCIYTAGEGGNVTIVALPKHHGMPIASDSLYPDSAFIKFNATNSPGINPGDYDKIIVGEANEQHVHIEGLKRGKYFIFMTGYDTVIPARVTGGIPYEITLTSGEIKLDIPVTE